MTSLPEAKRIKVTDDVKEFLNESFVDVYLQTEWCMQLNREDLLEKLGNPLLDSAVNITIGNFKMLRTKKVTWRMVL